MRLSVRNKLFAGFLAVVALMIMLGIFELVKMGGINNSVKYVGTKAMPSIATLGDLDTIENEYRVAQLQHVITTHPAVMKQQETKLAELAQRFDKEMTQSHSTLSNGEDRQLWTSVDAGWKHYEQQSTKTIELSRAGKTQQAIASIDTSERTFDQLSASLAKWRELHIARGNEFVRSSESSYSSSKTLVLALLVIATLVACGIAFFIARGITNGIRQMLAAAERIGDGDLTVDVESKSRVEIGDMARAFQRMTDKPARSRRQGQRGGREPVGIVPANGRNVGGGGTGRGRDRQRGRRRRPGRRATGADGRVRP